MSIIRKRPDENLVVPDGKPVIQAGGFVDGDQNPLLAPGTADVSALQKAQPSYLDSAKGALRETIAAKALRGWEYTDIPSEDGFDANTALGDKVSAFTSDELEFLGDARSSTEMQQRLGQVTQTRENTADMAAHPVVAVASSLLDADLVIGLGVGKLASASRLARLTAGLAANTAVLGYADQGGHLSTAEIIGSTLGAALSAVPKATRAVSIAEDVAPASGATERATVAATEEVPLRTPDVPPAPTTARVPDPDYVPPKPDLSTSHPYVEVVRGNGRATLQTDSANFVRGVLDTSTDLPVGVRALGEALHESLVMDGRVPLIVRTERTSSRSNNELKADGSMLTTMYTKSGAQDTLTDTIKAMTPYEKTIALHEATHAKTQSAINSFLNGTLPAGAAYDAVSRIDAIRKAVRGTARSTDFKGIAADDWRNNVMYGLNNPNEFIAQLFNSESFRSVLQATKIDGQSIWSDLVQKVVQAFTGKAPTGNALDHTVAAFEELLKLPRDANIGARSAKSVPEMQSPLIQNAPDPTVMMDQVGKTLNRNFALYDAIKQLGNRAATLADQLVVDATGSAANSATHYARTAHLAANVAAAQVDDGIKQAMRARGWSVYSRTMNPTRYLAARRELSETVYAQLAENHTRFRNGSSITPHADPSVQKIIDNFAQSRWAEDQLDRIKTVGMRGADGIEASPYYLPRRHSGTQVSRFLRDNPNVTRADIEGMYGSQFARMFAEQGIETSTARALGRQMLKNMDDRASGVSGYRQHVAGMTGDDIEFAMRNAGIEEDKIAQFLRTADDAGSDANTVRNLRGRADFDMTADYRTSSGALINPQMFVDKDVTGLMEGYSRTMSGRIGLAQAGFPDVKSLAKAVDDAAAEAADPRKAKELLDNTVNQILGYPTGENVPDILRSFAVMSGAVQLANSGIYQLADAALLLKEFGVTKVMKGLSSTQWGRDGLALAQSAEYGTRLRDVLEARNVLSGRYRTLNTHLEDNTDIGSMGIAHQHIQQIGQSTRFVNGLEYIRRGQSKLMAGLVGDSIDSAIRGDAAAQKAVGRFGLTDELIQRGKAAFDADPDLRTWPSSLRLEMETVAQNMADSLVLENRLGEVPAWMQFSSLGKFILPYMNFVAGSWNKILRRTYNQEGAKGIAMMLAYQLPLTTLSSIGVLATGDKPITPTSVASNVISQLPLMSWMGYAVNMATQGPSNTIAALGLVDKAFTATAGIVTGNADAAQIIRAVPFISILPGIRIMAAAMEEE